MNKHPFLQKTEGKLPGQRPELTMEGPLKIEIAAGKDGLVHVNLGKNVSWLVISPVEAKTIARTLATAGGAKRVVIE